MREDITAWMVRDEEEREDEGERVCPLCGERVRENFYDVDGDWGCADCFLGWVLDMKPVDLAEAMGVDHIRAD